MKKDFKVIFWDLETLPNIQEVAKRLPSIGQWPGRTLKSDVNSIICFGYKILGNKKAKCISVWDLDKNWNRDRNNDKELVKVASKILSTADVIVTHNGKSFDLKVLNSRLAKYNLPPLPKIIHVDTKNVAKANLNLYSNSLDELAKFLSCTPKLKFQDKWQLWVDLMFQEDTKSKEKLMSKYCKQDVDTLNEVFDKLKPFIKILPNYNQSGDGTACPNCGGYHLQRRGVSVTKRATYNRYQCQNCGTWSQQKLTKREFRDTL